MAGIASITVVGRLSKDPESKQVGDKMVTTVTVPTEYGWKEDNRNTTWFTAALWDKQAEFASTYLTKGTCVSITGRLNVRKWQSKDGADGFSVEIMDARLDTHTTKAEAEAAGIASEPRTQARTAPAADDHDNDVDPFADD